MYKAVLVLCAQALIQSTSAQCIGALGLADGYGWGGYGLGAPCGAPWGLAGPLAAPWGVAGEGWAGAYDGAWGAPFAGIGVAALDASNGGGLIVTSASPIAPTGVSMTSENAYEGPLAVAGAVPFLGAIALEGALPTIGAGAVTYGCGNGNVAIISEDLAAYGPFAGPAFAGPLGYDGYAGYAGPLGYDGLVAPGYAGYGYAGCAGPWY